MISTRQTATASPGRASMPMIYPRFHYRAPGSNVTVWARLTGAPNPDALRRTADNMRVRHPLLGATIHLLDDGSAEFRFNEAPDLEVRIIEPQPGLSPSDHALQAQKEPFDLDTGPLARILLVQEEHHAVVILICHHTICDGRSLVGLLRDLLRHLGAAPSPVEEAVPPPSVTAEHFSSAASPGTIERLALRSVNRRWRRCRVEYDSDDYQRLHRDYWASGPHVLTGGLSAERTRRLAEECRRAGITVHTALCAVFLMASEEVSETHGADRRRISMAADLRPYMIEDPGQGLGLCASGFSVDTHVRPHRPFWREAQGLHRRIQRALASSRSLYGILALNELDPSLIDALQFGMHGVVANRLVAKLLRTMRFDRVRFGLGMTNLGRVRFPSACGAHEVRDVVFQPPIFPNLEKVLGVLTTEGGMRFTLVSHPETLSVESASNLLSLASRRLRALTDS